MEYSSPWAWFDFTTLVVIVTDCICSCYRSDQDDTLLQKEKGQTTVSKTYHGKQEIEQHKSHSKPGWTQMLRTGRQFLLHILWYRTKIAKTIRRISIITIYLTIRTIYNREFDTCAMDTYISYSESISHIAFNSIARNCLIMRRNLKWKYCSLLNINVNLYSVIEWKLILVLLVTLYNPYYNNIYDTIEYSCNQT